MSTLALTQMFRDLAIDDQVHRLVVLHGELCLVQAQPSQHELRQKLAAQVQQLMDLGVKSAYQQACVFVSVWMADVNLQTLAGKCRPQQLVSECIQQATAWGVPRGVFERLHHAFAAIGACDDAWLNLPVESDCLTTLNRPPAEVKLSCTYGNAPALSDCLEQLDAVNCLRTQSGLVHAVTDPVDAAALIHMLTETSLPRDSSIVSLSPIVERVELGINTQQGFEALQIVDLVDTRQPEIKITQQAFECTASNRQAVLQAWQQGDRFNQATVKLSAPVFEGSWFFIAGWKEQSDTFQFVTDGEIRLHLSAGAVHWYAQLEFEGTQVQLHIQNLSEVSVQWPLNETVSNTRLPTGEPILTRQYQAPLEIELTPVVAVGKPLPSIDLSTVGHLQFELEVFVNADTHQLSMLLKLSHSALCFTWQSVNPLCGWARGQSTLLDSACIGEWSLLNG